MKTFSGYCPGRGGRFFIRFEVQCSDVHLSQDLLKENYLRLVADVSTVFTHFHFFYLALNQLSGCIEEIRRGLGVGKEIIVLSFKIFYR